MAKLIIGVNDLASQCPNIAENWDYKKNYPLRPEMVTCYSGKKVFWLCAKGHSYDGIIANKTRRNDGCPYCSGHRIKQGVNDLATTHSELVKEWNYEKNGQLKPFMVYKGQERKVWWLCPRGHSYYSSIVSRTHMKSGCPYCAGQKIIVGLNDLASQRSEIAKYWDYDANFPLTPKEVTVSSDRKVHWKCKNGHTFIAPVSDMTRTDKGKRGCPYCSGRKAWLNENDLATTYSQLMKEWDFEKNKGLNPKNLVAGSHEKVWWKCKLGHSYETVINKRTSRGNGCPYCSGNKLLQGFNDLATTHKDLIKEWDYVKNGDLLPTMVQKGTRKDVWWKCLKYGHSWQATIFSRTGKMKRGCPYCAGKKVLSGFNDLATTHKDLIKEWDYERNGDLLPTMFSKGSSQKVWWKCEKGHSWETAISNRACSGNGCIYCSGTVGERLITKVLENNRIVFVREVKYKLNEQIYDNIPISICRYDFCLTDLNMYIEYDGEQHFRETDFFKKGPNFEKRKASDNFKNGYAFKKKGNPLLRIPYIYNVYRKKDKEKITQLLKDFISTRKIPQEIIDFYAQYEFSNYAKLAREWNAKQTAQ